MHDVLQALLQSSDKNGDTICIWQRTEGGRRHSKSWRNACLAQKLWGIWQGRPNASSCWRQSSWVGGRSDTGAQGWSENSLLRKTQLVTIKAEIFTDGEGGARTHMGLWEVSPQHYETPLELVTDHKPLELIYGPKSKPCAQTERWVSQWVSPFQSEAPTRTEEHRWPTLKVGEQWREWEQTFLRHCTALEMIQTPKRSPNQLQKDPKCPQNNHSRLFLDG